MRSWWISAQFRRINLLCRRTLFGKARPGWSWCWEAIDLGGPTAGRLRIANSATHPRRNCWILVAFELRRTRLCRGEILRRPIKARSSRGKITYFVGQFYGCNRRSCHVIYRWAARALRICVSWTFNLISRWVLIIEILLLLIFAEHGRKFR